MFTPALIVTCALLPTAPVTRVKVIAGVVGVALIVSSGDVPIVRSAVMVTRCFTLAVSPAAGVLFTPDAPAHPLAPQVAATFQFPSATDVQTAPHADTASGGSPRSIIAAAVCLMAQRNLRISAADCMETIWRARGIAHIASSPDGIINSACGSGVSVTVQVPVATDARSS